LPGYRSLARNRDFTVLWLGQTVSELGSRMSLFVLPLVAFVISDSALVAAWVEASHLIGIAVVLLPAGVLADRANRRAIMMAASGTGALLYGSLAVAGIFHTITIPHLAVVGLLTGVASGVFTPTQTAAIKTVVDRADLPTALSQNQARQHVARLAGGPLGGALLAVARWLPFLVDAVTFAVSFFALSRIRADLSAPPHEGPRPRLRAQLTEGVRFVLARPFFRVLMTWASLVNLTTNAVAFVLLLRMVEAGYHPAQIGLVETAAGIGGILGALAAPYIIERMRTGHLTVLVAWAVAVPLVPTIWTSNPLLIGLCVFCFLFMNPVGNAGISAYRLSITPDGLQGRVSAASQFLAVSVMPLAPVLGGLLFEAYGAAVAVALLLAATAALALLVTCSRSVRTVPRPSEWAATSAERELVAG
jgi:MFS family permease